MSICDNLFLLDVINNNEILSFLFLKAFKVLTSAYGLNNTIEILEQDTISLKLVHQKHHHRILIYHQ